MLLFKDPISSKVFPLPFFNNIHMSPVSLSTVTQFVYAMPTSIISIQGTWNTLYLFSAIKTNQTNKKTQLEAEDKFYHRTQVNFTNYTKWKAEGNLPQYLE